MDFTTLPPDILTELSRYFTVKDVGRYVVYILGRHLQFLKFVGLQDPSNMSNSPKDFIIVENTR